MNKKYGEKRAIRRLYGHKQVHRMYMNTKQHNALFIFSLLTHCGPVYFPHIFIINH
jgi:hypothetical protein